MNKWLTFFALILMVQNWAKADEIITSVFNVIDNERTERVLVLSGVDGRVYKFQRSEANIKYFKSFIGKIVKLNYRVVNNQAWINTIYEVNPREVDQATMDLNHFQYNQLRQFAPTDLQSLENATTLFNDMLNDGDKRRSQCFKRAHMWSFDMWSKLGVSSEKIFIFYTKRYSILEDFEWWFHVAPMVTVNGEQYVMDGTFMTKPITIEEWKNYFIKTDKITCPVITDYREYEKGHWNRLCFLMKTPMYYFSPLDIEARDAKGIERNHWVLEELQDARRAFKNYDTVYEGIDTGKKTITY